jgi:hypothetical protein
LVDGSLFPVYEFVEAVDEGEAVEVGGLRMRMRMRVRVRGLEGRGRGEG